MTYNNCYMPFLSIYINDKYNYMRTINGHIK